MTAIATAADAARALGLSADASVEELRDRASAYTIDSQFEHALGNHVHGAALNELASIALQGVQMRRAERLLDLLRAAAAEAVPVEPEVTTRTDAGLWVVAVESGGVTIVRAFHRDLFAALRFAARALLAREGAEGPRCEALREAVAP